MVILPQEAGLEQSLEMILMESIRIRALIIIQGNDENISVQMDESLRNHTAVQVFGLRRFFWCSTIGGEAGKGGVLYGMETAAHWCG